MTPRCLKKTIVSSPPLGVLWPGSPPYPRSRPSAGVRRVKRVTRMERMERRLPGMVLPLETPRYCRHQAGHRPLRPGMSTQHRQHSTVQCTQTQRVMSHVNHRHIEEPRTSTIRRSSTLVPLVSVSLS